jgi:pyruvate/2-oxoacid:ferredoxin oxidoreductase alpha subunit
VTSFAPKGSRPGNLRIILFQPFPFDAVRQYLGKVRKAAVLRNLSYGHHGIFYQE